MLVCCSSVFHELGCLRMPKAITAVLWLLMAAAYAASAPASHESHEPVIYVTLTRWENRTFSPRVYYLTMVQNNQEELRNPPEQAYAYETPPDGLSRYEDNQLSSMVVSPANSETSAEAVVDNKEGDKASVLSNQDSSIKTQTENRTVASHRGEVVSTRLGAGIITPSDERDPIVFKDVAVNRRQLPEKSQERRPDLEDTFQCSWNGRTPLASKMPRSVDSQIVDNRHHEQIDTMKLSLAIAHSADVTAQNMVYSPMSIFSVLALLLRGSVGSTFNELSEILGPLEDPSELSNATTKDYNFHRTLAHLLYVLNNCSDPNVVVESANELFTDSNFPVHASYAADLAQLYGASARSFDFKAGAHGFQEYVNEWVREKTKGKIKSIIDSPPSPLTTLAVANAIYFHGSWETPFEPQITRDALFYIDHNSTAPVKLMTNVMNASYIENETYKMVRLPYEDGETALHILLPRETGINGVLDLERSLKSAELKRAVDAMTTEMVTVKIPKMRIESDGNVKEILFRLGIHSIFDPTSANFSRISDTPGLHVSALLHRAIIDINEKGTEAAAVSLATGDRTIDSLPIPFIVNRPFLFFIYNSFVDSVLFWGRVIHPQPLVE